MDLKSYRSALKTVHEADLAHQAQIELSEEKKKTIRHKYLDLIDELNRQILNLEHKRDKEMQAVTDQLKDYENQASIKDQPYRDIIDQTETLFKYMNVYQNTPLLRQPDDGSTVIIANPYLNITVRVATNRKPKNCYTLVMVTNSIFRYAFEQYFHWNNSCDIKHAPTKEDLWAWFEENKDTLCIPVRHNHPQGDPNIKDFLKTHEELVANYEHARQLYDTSLQWRIAYWLNQKKYYETSVSGGTRSPEYQGILDMLKIIRTPEQNLPLLLASVKSERGLEELSKLIKGVPTHA